MEEEHSTSGNRPATLVYSKVGIIRSGMQIPGREQRATVLCDDTDIASITRRYSNYTCN